MTSIEWLDEQIQEYVIAADHVANTMVIQISFEEYMDLKRQAKEMHKKEIEQSFIDGRFSGCGCYNYMKESDPEKYYKQIFKIK